jgi:hypothetical protein
VDIDMKVGHEVGINIDDDNNADDLPGSSRLLGAGKKER